MHIFPLCALYLVPFLTHVSDSHQRHIYFRLETIVINGLDYKSPPECEL